MSGVITGDHRVVKVSEVTGQSRVKATVARSRWKVNGSMLLCETSVAVLRGSDGLHRNVC